VDDAERTGRRRENTDGPVAAACARRCPWRYSLLIGSRTDGTSVSPYVESSAVAPLNVYGHSKADAEVRVLEAFPRRSWFVRGVLWAVGRLQLTVALCTLALGDTFLAAEDALSRLPTSRTLCMPVSIDRECGLWHLANPGAIAWADLARQRLLACDDAFTQSKHEPWFPAPAQPTAFLAVKGRASCSEDAINRYFHERDCI